ncbi:SpaH/EbpB family LPXTG-anchored major pilin [Anaerostipes hadrus]|uniref:SpaH/EbpB family LPXTG-anchored major pilin n=1 Tax=Anaerostipes hadrus TaxID=649756 RepID=UPI003563B5B9
MRIKNMIKKATVAALTAVMILAPIVNVKASSSDVIDTSKTGSLTIHKYDMTAAKQGGVNLDNFTSTGKQDTAAEAALEKYAIKGVEFSYLRVGDVEQQSENGKIQMIYELPTALQQILGLASSDAAKTEGSKTYFTSQIINDKLAQALEDNTATKDKLEAYMGQSGTAMDETNANGVTSKDKLPLGLYLIVETKVPENVTYTTNPWFVQLPSTDSNGDDWFYDVICYPKNETGNPTLDKRVRNNPDQDNVTTANADKLADFTSARNEYKYQSTVTASKAEKLDYQFISKLPHITSSTTYLTTYTFDDTMAKGMTYSKDAVIAIYENRDAADSTNVNNVDKSGAIAVWKSSDTNPKFTTTYGKSGDGSTMKIEMTKAGLNELNKKYSDKYIMVYYTAKVNTDDRVVLGDKGNSNDVSLTWKRTSTNYYDILKDESIVYSYGYDLTKKFSDGKGDPTKVKFVVQNKSDNYYLVATGSNGVYQVTGKSSTEADATQFSPSSTGKLVINGIEADEYGFTETHSDAGYSLLKKEIIVKITKTEANITPTEANITGIQSKSDTDSTANDGVPNGAALKNDVTVQTTAASATVDNTKVTMTKRDESNNAYVNMEITNQKQFMLPMTGGAGSYLLIIAGVVAAGCGMMILRRNKRQPEK